jgi:hypothetical protein
MKYDKMISEIARGIRHLIDGEELTGTPEVNAIVRRIYENNYEEIRKRFYVEEEVI